MAPLLKDQLRPEDIRLLAAALASACPGFSADAFEKAVLDATWGDRALMPRIHHIAACMGDHLPSA